MSKYTTEVRYVCEVESGLVESQGFNSINTILDNSRTKIFNFPYPIFDEAYRPVLEKKILKHYYTREICAETVGLWKHYLDMRMNEHKGAQYGGDSHPPGVAQLLQSLSPLSV